MHEGAPHQQFLEETRESLEALRRDHGVEHALSVAQKAEEAIRTMIEKDLWPSVEDSTTEMKMDWETELQKWQERVAEIEAFIDTYSSEEPV